MSTDPKCSKSVEGRWWHCDCDDCVDGPTECFNKLASRSCECDECPCGGCDLCGFYGAPLTSEQLQKTMRLIATLPPEDRERELKNLARMSLDPNATQPPGAA